MLYVVPADVRPDKIPGSLIKSEYAGSLLLDVPASHNLK